MSEKIIKCAKCQQNAEQDWNRFRDEYTASYPIRDKDGQIYCWDCYKNKSHCEGCGKSVAKIKFPRSGQPEYPHCNGGVSYNCERISNEVKFICSKKCSQDIAEKKYQDWKNKLGQGWTKCEKCIKRVKKLIEWFEEDGIKNSEWLKEERGQSRFIKLVPPNKGKLCLEKWGCKWDKEVGKPHHKEVQFQAQKYWEGLSYDERLREVIRSRNAKQVAWGGKFENLTAEQIATQNEVPSGIRQEFELKDCHQDCSDCHLDKNFQKSSDNNLSAFSSVNENNNEAKKEEIVKKLVEAKRQGIDKKKIERLRSELQKLNQQKEGITPAKNNNELILGIVIIFSVFVLISGVILISKNNKKKK